LDEFVKQRIYLTLERGRDICLRNLFRKVFLAAGFEEGGVRRTRVGVVEFVAGMRLSLGGFGGAGKLEDGEEGVGNARVEEVGRDEVECLIANMIYKVSELSRAGRFSFLRFFFALSFCDFFFSRFLSFLPRL